MEVQKRLHKLPGLLCALSFPLSAFASPLRVGYIDYHPIVMKTSKGPAGYLIDYIKPALDRAGFTPQWRDLATNRALTQMQQGHIDVFLTLLRAPAREALIEYSEAPLFEAHAAVCSKPGAIRLPPQKPLKIAHFLSTVLPASLLDHDLIPVTPEEVTQRMLTMLARDRIDAIYYVYPDILALSLAKSQRELPLECFVLQDVSMNVYMAYSKKLAPESRAKLNSALREQALQVDFRGYVDNLLKTAKVRNFRKVESTTQAFQLVKTPK